jgi:hypothetical protein
MPNKLDTKTHQRIREPVTEIEALRAEVLRLRARVKQLEHQVYLNSWRTNPDRMGS